ncbi:MAG: putative Ig domain-containing protein [Geothrix sp.]|nr:putative Ig domain-containing protein [Geothrix sp.]
MATSAFTSSLRRSPGVLHAALALSLVALAPACGGGGSAAPVAPVVPAPTSLAYATNPAVYAKGTPIAANTPTVISGSTVTYSVSPALPSGLALNATTGTITGTPTAVAAVAIFAVRATNAGGSATANLSITVNDLAPGFDYSSSNLLYGKDVPITPLTPTSTGGAITAWSVAPALPAGLAFSPTTGTISGTPTVGAPLQAYTVTATNSGGTLGKMLNLTVIGAPPLIAGFTASPSTVPMGSPTTLSWTLTGDPASALSINGASVLGALNASVTPRRRQTYTLLASNLKGTASAGATVAARGLDLFAGNVDGAGWVDGTGAAARFNQPQGVAADAVGNLYVSDTNNHTIRKITPGGAVTLFAGYVGEMASWDGTPGGFRNPAGLAIDTAGNLYVADRGNSSIRKVTPAGVVSTLAGNSGSTGSADGTGATARFFGPRGLAITAAGDLIVADTNNHLLRRVTAAGVVTTLAGSAGLSGISDGTGASARFNYPAGVVVHGNGNIYVTDTQNQTLRQVTAAGVVTTLAGSPGLAGTTDGTGTAARLYLPHSLAVDGAGDLWITDAQSMIRKVTTAGVVTTAAGASSSLGWVDGPVASARFSGPAGLAFLPSGRLAIADEFNHAVRVMDMTQGLSTFAGAPARTGNMEGSGSAARFFNPAAVVVDGSGNAFVADYGNSAIRKVTPAGQTSTFASVAYPTGLAMDGAGNLFVTDQTNQTLLKITPAGVVSTLAGLSGTPGSADGTGSAARFNYPQRVALDGAGNLYVTEIGNHTIRKVTPAGVVTTVAGLAGATGLVDGNGAAARFYMPSGIAVDGSGNLFVGDLNNNRIRRITPAGDVSTLALSTFVYGPVDLAFAASGTLYVADAWGHALYTVDTATGTTALLLGTPNRVGAFPGAFPAGLSYPSALAFTPQGDLLITTTNGLMLATAP